MKIDKNVPIPEKENNLPGKARKYPFPDMVIGESFLEECEPEDYTRIRQNVATACNRFKKENPSYNFTVRKIEGGVRVWRVEAKKKQF